MVTLNIKHKGESPQELYDSLRRVASGTGLVLLGTVVSQILAFIPRVMVVRYLSRSEYGLLALGLAVVTVLATVSTLGFINAVPRFLARALGQGDHGMARATVRASVRLVALAGLALGLLLFLAAPYVAAFFHKPSLAIVVKVLALLVPCTALLNLLVTIARGLEDVKAKVYFQDIAPVVLRITFIGGAIVLGFSLRGILWAYVMAGVIAFLSAFVYVTRSIRHIVSPISIVSPVGRKLLLFSLPLLGANICEMARNWADTIILGYFRTATVVGLYNAALRVAQLTQLPLNALIFVYLPIASRLHIQGRIDGVKHLYISATKWTFFFSFPLLLCFFCISNEVLGTFFGQKYVSASPALRILVLAFLFHAILGPIRVTLISLGMPTVTFISNAIAAFIGICSGMFIIPKYGLIGTAWSRVFSSMSADLVAFFVLFRHGVHPFAPSFFKPLGVALMSLAVCPSLWELETSSLLIIISGAVLIFIGIFFQNFSPEDVWLLKRLEVLTKYRRKH